LGLRVELVLASLPVPEAAPKGPAREALVGAIREACNNVLKHAGVTGVVVRAVPAGGGLQVTVRDHDRGFDPRDAQQGFGLAHSIRQRLADVGEKAEISSTPGRGTKVTLWVPT
jgi:signal transduction histidine kinase